MPVILPLGLSPAARAPRQGPGHLPASEFSVKVARTSTALAALDVDGHSTCRNCPMPLHTQHPRRPKTDVHSFPPSALLSTTASLSSQLPQVMTDCRPPFMSLNSP